MKQERNTDQYGRVLEGSERNPNEWVINHVESMQGGLRLCYISGRKLSGASYILELTDDELDRLRSRHRSAQS